MRKDDLVDLVAFSPSMEDAMNSIPTEAPTGESKKEIEWEIYGRIKDLGDLKKAERSELQEQWGIPIHQSEKNVASGNIRVRSINDEKYVLTSKIKEKAGNDEVEEDTTEARFMHFKKLADAGLRKQRFFFPIPGSDFIWEVDGFYNAVGQLQPWVKIDLEVDRDFDLDELPELPFEMEDVRVIRPGKKNEEDLAFVRQLFDEFFNLDNVLKDKHAPEQPSVESDEAPTPARLEELVEHKKFFQDLLDSISSARNLLSFNESKPEGALKQLLEECSMAITKLLNQK